MKGPYQIVVPAFTQFHKAIHMLFREVKHFKRAADVQGYRNGRSMGVTPACSSRKLLPIHAFRGFLLPLRRIQQRLEDLKIILHIYEMAVKAQSQFT